MYAQLGCGASTCIIVVSAQPVDKKLQGDLAAWFGSVPAVPAACEGNELLGPDGCKVNGIDNFERIHFWRTPVSKCASQDACVPYYRWVTDYIAVLGGR